MQGVVRSSSACVIVCATGGKHCKRSCDHRLPCQGRAHLASLAGVARATFSKYPPRATRKSVLLLLTSNDPHLWMALGGASGRCGTGPSTRDGRSLGHPALGRTCSRCPDRPVPAGPRWMAWRNCSAVQPARLASAVQLAFNVAGSGWVSPGRVVRTAVFITAARSPRDNVRPSRVSYSAMFGQLRHRLRRPVCSTR